MYTTQALLAPARISLLNLIDLTDDPDENGATTGEVNETVLDAVIQDAQTEIDNKLRGRYPVPFADPIPAEVERLTAVLTLHGLFSRSAKLGLPDGLARQYKAAQGTLDAIRRGDEVLKDFEAAQSHPGFSKVNKSASDRLFSKTTLAGF